MSQNIANYIQDPEILMPAFMESPGHRNNMINSIDSKVGIACAFDQNGKIWWAINFHS
ncbi:MAG: hypothetical protein KDD42_05985 [Bdellovibrionales bacterium]|nr:hypothetical protein [Bdellovibrionales bacterium]